jgi:hypothetical protein
MKDLVGGSEVHWEGWQTKEKKIIHSYSSAPTGAWGNNKTITRKHNFHGALFSVNKTQKKII